MPDNKKDLLSKVFFIVMLLLVYFLLNYQEILFLRPMSIHQWAQCDRASVARNYAQDGMNFFKPHTHFLSNTNGITGLEFPLMNYMAAICYKLFGFNEFWYRALSLLFLSIGLFFTFRIAELFLKQTLLAALITLSWYLSPILCYYSPNFLSDAASLGFIMSAWYFYFRYCEQHVKKFLLLFFFFAALASLIKVSSVMSIVVIVIITLTDYFSNKIILLQKLVQDPNVKRNGILIYSLLVFLLVIAWYGYAATLSNKMTDKIFLVGTNAPQSWSDVPWVWNDVKKLFLPYYYHWIMYLVYAFSLFVLFFRFKKMHPLLRLITCGLGAGLICFVYLFFNQFRQHDYYIIALLPFFFFLLITAVQYLQTTVKHQTKFNFLLSVFFLFICCISIWWSNLYLQDKYADDHFPYNNIENYMESFGVKPTDKVITLYDNSFNIQLYFMNRKGWRIEKGKIEKRLEGYINQGAKFIIVNDTSALNNVVLRQYLKKETGEFLGVHIFSIQ